MSPNRFSGLSHAEAAALAGRHKLRRLGARPRFASYIKALVRRRHFIWYLASSNAMGRNQGSYLGQVWAVLDPLLHFAVLWLVFGYILDAREGTKDFISFLAVGTFLFGFMASGVIGGSKSIHSRLALVRALEFPRAVLPTAVTLTEMIMEWPAVVVMMIILLIRGNPITWTWLGLIPVLLLMYGFTLGMAFILARMVSTTPDYANLVPIAVTMLRYVSGVFYSIATFASALPVLSVVLSYQPFALYLSLARACVQEGFTAQWYDWAMGVFWAVFFGVVGLVFFWRAEARYGRD
ncbi:MAG: ABC transporter permease [Bifidobacteriaceae bacterium]|jgi:teichoic acid transport system permease protein|nr:ABC transporter permease [Bifidobacteriaceae bacterium]